MNGTKATALIMGVSLASLSLLAPGCLIVGRSNVTYGGKGRMVSQATLDQIEVGKSSTSKLVAILGKPTRTEQYDDDTALYVYEYSKKKKGTLMMFLLLNSSTRGEQVNRLYYEINNDVVQNSWRD